MKRVIITIAVLILLTNVIVRQATAIPTELPRVIVASWYSIASLKKEGTWKRTKGVMANGELFSDTALTCSTRLYPLDSVLRVTSILSGRSVFVRVTDRIGKRFANTRIDLSQGAFSEIADCEQGLVPVIVERIK